MKVDVSTIYLILVFAAVFSAAQAVIGLVRTATARRLVNRRLAVAERAKGLAELVVELRKQRGLGADGRRKGRWAWLGDLIVRSGVRYAPRRWAMIAVVLAAAGTFLAGVLTHNLLLAPIGALLTGVGGPLAYLKFMASRRARILGQQLPQALEVIVRSLEAGHPVPTAIGLVGREMPDPIGSEFGLTGDEIVYGATLEQAVERMAARCQHPDVDLFAATIRLQERAGGNLTRLLKLNAATVRERSKMRLKIKAVSSEGRVSATILTAAPFAAAAIIMVASPKFYGEVIHEPFIQTGLGLMGFWMFVGNVIIRRMVDMRI